MLRKDDLSGPISDGGQDGDEICVADDNEDDYGAGTAEAKLHDGGVLPHMYSDDDIQEYFPQAKAAEQVDWNDADYEPDAAELVYGPRNPQERNRRQSPAQDCRADVKPESERHCDAARASQRAARGGRRDPRRA